MWTSFNYRNFTESKFSDKVTRSPPFYTSIGGYKMCIKLDVNGYGCGTESHVSVYAFLMRGENDEHLEWPFSGSVTVELLNQLEDKNHHSKSILFQSDSPASRRPVGRDIAPSGYGHPCYISHSLLEYNATKNCQYLKNDCLSFRVKTVTTPMSQWLGQKLCQLYSQPINFYYELQPC